MTENEVLEYFTTIEPTEAQCEEADRFQPVYFFAVDRTGDGICSSCHQVIGVKGDKHLDYRRCPRCGKNGHVIHMWRYKGNYIRQLRRNVLTYHLEKSQKDPDVLLCRAVYSMYEVFKGDVAVKTTRFTEAWYAFVPGKGGYCVTWNRRWYPDWDYGNGKGAETGGNYPRYTTLRKQCRGRHKLYYTRYKENNVVDVIAPAAEEWWRATDGQKLQYACDYYSRELSREYCFIELMDKIAKWPLAMEQLGKIGLDKMMLRVIEHGAGIGNLFNMKGKNIKAMLRVPITRQDIELTQDARVSTYVYKGWLLAKQRRYGSGLALETFIECLATRKETELYTALDYAKPERILSYVEKQAQKQTTIKVDLGFYADYIGECVKLNIDLGEKTNLFPRDLVQMHNSLSSQITYQANEKLEIRYHERYESLLEGYSYADDNYSIVVPDKVGDLIREGKIQHICVGNYVDRVAYGQTDVVYIRSNEALDIPLCTMEIRDGSIIQVRAKYNEKPPEAVAAFVEKFRRDKLEKGA